MELTPKQIVRELDRYIIGQDEAKRAVAVALRNRYRRAQLPEEIRDEIVPKNILMVGPTGVGKTEIARRLAKLVDAPFVKVEATKFTEVGYVGRDVESIIRDLVEASVRMLRVYFAGFFFQSFQFCGQSVFQSLGWAKYAITFSLLRKVVIVVPLTLLLPVVGLGTTGVFLAEPISNIVGGLACYITMLCTAYKQMGRE